MIGYVCYVDRFAGDLRGLRNRLDYLEELGVTYLHLMPLLQPRDGENDGGYAVVSYDQVDRRLGTMDDLEHLASQLRTRAISLCIDLVINHTASDHEWAQKAAAGDPTYRGYYRIFPDRTMPDEHERTLREVFPEFTPGNFSPLGDEWVWTTFNEYQWDLNYGNPDVFCAMLEVMCHLANRGVEVLRLDAVPFLWKRLGTDCENQPEAHALLRAFRAFMRIAAPAVVFKAEAIVPPHQLVPYLGAAASPGEPSYDECQIAYHNQLMVMIWSSFATGDGALATAALARMGSAPEGTTWVTYVRCHDDIGWAVDDHDAWSVGWTGGPHRSYLSDFYGGTFPGTFARGELFQQNPLTGDARVSGSAASLCGIEAALADGDTAALALAIDRLELAHALTFAFGGIPLIYMGDELAQRNDPSYLSDPALAADNRWMHRPVFDTTAAGQRHVAGSIEHDVFSRFVAIGRARRSIGSLGGDHATHVLGFDDRRLFGFERIGPAGRFAMVANFSNDTVTVDMAGSIVHSSSGVVADTTTTLRLPPLGYAWLVLSEPETGDFH